jgi:hypothetical protein
VKPHPLSTLLQCYWTHGHWAPALPREIIQHIVRLLNHFREHDILSALSVMRGAALTNRLQPFMMINHFYLIDC